MWKAAVLAVSLLVAGTCGGDMSPEFGVKLCGREFIRAVIFTCGGSRWRRGPVSSGDGARGPGVPALGRGARSASLEDILGALRSAGRAERDVVVGLSNACCKWGCSKNEISSLC
ncbi:relaxin-3b [Conger conger]|uniref:relaxin-3b n=1 Tax=Conger conger TaxID=82655 RepID=UPI002A5AAFD1|nr:relaxin-3b [Conger conger]